MNANVIEFNKYKENVDFISATDDRKRVFLRMLENKRVKGKLDIIKGQLLILIGLGRKKKVSSDSLKLNPTIFGMSNKEFAILRSILDGGYSLSGYEKLSSTEQENFIFKCLEIFNEEGNLTLSAYISYCKRKFENYDVNNFGDE